MTMRLRSIVRSPMLAGLLALLMLVSPLAPAAAQETPPPPPPPDQPAPPAEPPPADQPAPDQPADAKPAEEKPEEPKEAATAPQAPATQTPDAPAAASSSSQPTGLPETLPPAGMVTGQVLVGGQMLSEDPPNSAKFFEYRDVPSGFVAESVNLFWTPRARSFFLVDAYDISQQDSRGAVEFGTFDQWRGSIHWINNPRHWGDDPEQLWARQGDAVFTLDDSLQAAVQAAPAQVDTTPADGQWDAGTKGALIKTAIDQSGQDVDLGHERRVLGASMVWTPVQTWAFGIDATRERRSGTAPQSLGNYFALAPGEVAAPVDFRTDWANLRAEYHRPNLNIGGSIGVSKFESGYHALTWDDQLSLVDQPVSATLTSIPGTERLLLGTDNKALTATIYGGINLPGRTRIDATLSATDVTQDDPFLTMTVNTQLQPLLAPLPDSSFDGEHQYSLLQIRASGRPTKQIRWNAWARQYELDNQSPSLSFPEYVQTDYAIPLCGSAAACGATTNRIARRSLPYAYEKDTYGALVGWTPAGWFDGSLSYELTDNKRDFAAVEDSQEDRFKLTLDFTVGEQWTIRTTATKAERRADEYDPEYNLVSFPIGESAVAASNEGMRKFFWTDRDRDVYGLQVEWTPNERWSVYAEASWAKDDYLDPNTGQAVGTSEDVLEDRNPVDGTPEPYTLLLAGRTFDKDQSYSLGASFSPSPRLSVFADYTWEQWEYRLVSRYRNVTAGVGTDNPLDDWGSDANDKYGTATLGLHAELDQKLRWKLDVDGSWAKGTGDLSTDFVAGGSASGDTTLTEFPQLENTLVIARAQLTKVVSPRVSWLVRYWYESWNENNWASDFMQPYMGDPGNDPGSATAAYLGWDFDDYTYQVLSAFVRLGF
jgi:MtrB/PioB family decaheme-associated outer membrane protein